MCNKINSITRLFFCLLIFIIFPQLSNGMTRVKRYIILNPHQNICEQITRKNTIYEVRDTFDISINIQETIKLEIPTSCELIFNGGMIRNGTLVGNNTRIIADSNRPIFSKVDIQGTYIIKDIYVDYMEIPNPSECGEEVRSVLRLQNSEISQRIYFPQKNLCFTPALGERHCMAKLTSNTEVFLNADLSVNGNNQRRYEVFDISQSKNITIHGQGHVISGDVGQHTYKKGEEAYGIGVKITDASNVTVDSLTTEKFTCDGLYIGSNVNPNSDEVYYCNYGITFNSCRSVYNGRQGLSVICGEGINLIDCEFSYTGKIDYQSPGCGIDFEPNFGKQGIKDVQLVNCHFRSNNSYAAKFYLRDNGQYSNITINKCHFINDEVQAQSTNGIYLNNKIEKLRVIESVVPFFSYSFASDLERDYGTIEFEKCEMLGIMHWRKEKTAQFAARFKGCTFGGQLFKGIQENERHAYFYMGQHIDLSFVECVFDYRSVRREKPYYFGYQGKPDVELCFESCIFYDDASSIFGNKFINNTFYSYSANLSGSKLYESVFKGNRLLKGSNMNGQTGSYVGLYCFTADIALNTNAEISDNTISGVEPQSIENTYPIKLYKGSSAQIGKVTIRDNVTNGTINEQDFVHYLKKNVSTVNY